MCSKHQWPTLIMLVCVKNVYLAQEEHTIKSSASKTDADWDQIPLLSSDGVAATCCQVVAALLLGILRRCVALAEAWHGICHGAGRDGEDKGGKSEDGLGKHFEVCGFGAEAT